MGCAKFRAAAVHHTGLHSRVWFVQSLSKVDGPEVAAGWCKAALAKLVDEGNVSMKDLIFALSNRIVSHSTAYSGILAPETADSIICHTARSFFDERGCKVGKPLEVRQLWACEQQAQAQEVILAHGEGPRCCFDDVRSLAPRAVRQAMEADPKMEPDKVKQLLKTMRGISHIQHGV